jgi:putative PIN family toxin of toxin-antitoxin system
MKVVVDTNVIVSALLNVNGIPAQILTLVLNGKLKISYDNRILFEYMDVLTRKEFGFDRETIDSLINCFKDYGDYVFAESIKKQFVDEAVKKFYEVHKSGMAQYLITGNKRHFPKEETIITPKDFMEIRRII